MRVKEMTVGLREDSASAPTIKKPSPEPAMDSEGCVLCRRDTGIRRDEDVSKRPYYAEGIGQLCEACWKQVYGE